MEQRLLTLEKTTANLASELKQMTRDAAKNELEMVNTLHRIEIQLTRLVGQVDAQVKQLGVVAADNKALTVRIGSVERNVSDIHSVLKFVKFFIGIFGSTVLGLVAKAVGVL